MKISLVFTLFVVLCLLPNSTTIKKNLKKKRDASSIFKTIHFLPKAIEILKDVYDLWEFFSNNQEDPDSDGFKDIEHKTFWNVLKINSKLSTLEQEVKVIADTTITTSILQTFPKILELELNLHELKLIMNHINFANEQMQNYIVLGYDNITAEVHNLRNFDPKLMYFSSQNSSNENHISHMKEMSNSIKETEPGVRQSIDRFTLENFATLATSSGYNSVLSLLRRMNDLIVQDETDGLFYLIQNAFQEMRNSICNLKESPYQTLYNLFNKIAVAELKGNIVLQFSYMLLKMYKKGNFTAEAELALSNYDNYTKQKLEVVRNVLSKTERSFHKCDPEQFVEGVTYSKLTGLLQGYIENEVNLNPYGTCRENCQYYQYTEYNGCFKNQFCAHQPQCRGKVINCRYVDSDMNICTSSNPERRYDWIEYENGKILGNKGVCEKKNLFTVDSWWRYLFWHCSYCLCLCDDVNKGSDRYFNLRDVVSDIQKNKIVTGVRIVKQNQIVHMQIQQGVLSPMGVVNKTTLSWKSLDNYTIDDDNVENNVDYHTTNWLERAIDTDEVFGPSEHVVTGLRFRKIGTHLNLEVRVTPINFTTGQVYTEDHSYWLGNDNTDGNPNSPRTEIVLTNPDIPIRNGPHSLDSKHDQYIQFQPTSFDTDAGQSTVPYLDSQALTSQGFPLSGIGLIHRGKLGSGGFIAPKLISYDYTPHLQLNRTK